MATTITVPVTGVDNIECLGSAILTPTTVTIRYDRREQPHVKLSGPTRDTTDSEPTECTFHFSACTCRKWLADIVEHHRPAGYRRWEHAEWSAWEVTVGRWINIPDTPDPHRDFVGALEAALADTAGCEVLQYTLRDAIALERNRRQ